MISDSEQKRLQEIEAALQGEDPKLARRLATAGTYTHLRRRRAVSIVLAALAVAGVVVGLALPSVPLAVISLCAIGAAGMIFTWQPPHRGGTTPEPPASD